MTTDAQKEYRRQYYLANKDRERALNKEYRRVHRKEVLATQRADSIWRRYGITIDEYNKLMAEPCAICGKPSEHLDHCHKTGRVRKALCQQCNHGLGNFQDDPDLLAKAIEYLLQ